MKAFKEGYSLTSCKKNVQMQLHYRAVLLEEKAATKLLVSGLLPCKAICHFLKAEALNPSSSSPSVCRSTQWQWPGKCTVCPPEEGVWAGQQGVASRWGTPSTSAQSWASLSHVTHLIKVRKQSLLLRASSGIFSKTSVLLPPLPSWLTQTCPQAWRMVFLKSYY